VVVKPVDAFVALPAVLAVAVHISLQQTARHSTTAKCKGLCRTLQNNRMHRSMQALAIQLLNHQNSSLPVQLPKEHGWAQGCGVGGHHSHLEHCHLPCHPSLLLLVWTMPVHGMHRPLTAASNELHSKLACCSVRGLTSHRVHSQARSGLSAVSPGSTGSFRLQHTAQHGTTRSSRQHSSAAVRL
jgi:hypothetical protein